MAEKLLDDLLEATSLHRRYMNPALRRGVRERAGISRDALAELLGVTRGVFLGWETRGPAKHWDHPFVSPAYLEYLRVLERIRLVLVADQRVDLVTLRLEETRAAEFEAAEALLKEEGERGDLTP